MSLSSIYFLCTVIWLHEQREISTKQNLQRAFAFKGKLLICTSSGEALSTSWSQWPGSWTVIYFIPIENFNHFVNSILITEATPLDGYGLWLDNWLLMQGVFRSRHNLNTSPLWYVASTSWWVSSRVQINITVTPFEIYGCKNKSSYPCLFLFISIRCVIWLWPGPKTKI